jgi:uncharacterized protein YdhG (YjbR/CyaY superfamily)
MATKTTTDGFSAEEKAAIKERADELKAQAKGSEGEADVLAKIAEMPQQDRSLATHFHELVHDVAPDLTPRTWYGMPAYATPGKSGKIICFFQSAAKMKTRFNTIGFSDSAALDNATMWPTSFAVLEWNAGNEEQLRALVKKAVS